MSLELMELLEVIYAEFGPIVSERLDLHTSVEQKNTVMLNLKNWNPQDLAGRKVVRRVDVDGLKFVLEDGSWVLVRASGTEPVFRIYVETDTPDHILELQQAVREALSL